jgi:hypothetical protein
MDIGTGDNNSCVHWNASIYRAVPFSANQFSSLNYIELLSPLNTHVVDCSVSVLAAKEHRYRFDCYEVKLRPQERSKIGQLLREQVQCVKSIPSIIPK